MSEAFPESIDTQAPERVAEEISFEEDAASRMEVMSGHEAELLRTLDAIQPTTPEEEEILEALKQRTAELSVPRLDLKAAVQAAALERMLSGEANRSPESEAQAVEFIAKNPELAEMLMQRILAAAQLVGEQGLPSGGSGAKLAEDAKALIEEMEGSDSKLFKGLALRTAERCFRAAISAPTLGIGGIVYDSVKDTLVTLHRRSEQRTKHRSVLMGSAA